MNNDEPLAYFITWSVYGTHLQGASTGWRKYGKGEMRPQPLLESWRRERLNHSVVLLDQPHRDVVLKAAIEHCIHRNWHLWECNPRTNHVHAVVTATSHSGKVVRDQLKANCTRSLRERFAIFRDRPVWTVGGDWRCINSERELHRVIEYACDAQDRKDRDIP